MQNKPGLAARQSAATVMARIIDDGRGLDGLFATRHGPASLQRLDEQDRTLVRAIALTACRHRGVIIHLLDRLLKRPVPRNARHLAHTLHVAAAQILFMNVPDSAAVDLAVTALNEEKRSTRFAGLANAVLRRLSREKDALLASLSLDERAKMNTPDWLFKRLRKAYGRERALAIAGMHMHEPALDLSVKETPDVWAEKLEGRTIFGRTIRVAATGSLENWPGYAEGEWWVQDAAAGLPAVLLGDVAGKRVLDLCAAPGGKTAQLATAGAKVTAVDSVASRIARLNSNLDRLRLTANVIEADVMSWTPDEPFDAVLLDAPCSSTGTIRRHPDVAWTKTPQIVAQLAGLQRDMIERAASMVKSGGTLVFANCSLDRSEGEDIVASLDCAALGLISDAVRPEEVFGHAEFITGQGTLRTLPCHLAAADPMAAGLDGFFAARFRKK